MAWQHLRMFTSSPLQPRTRIWLFFLLLPILVLLLTAPGAAESKRLFRAGAYSVDVTPEKLPVHVLGSFTDRVADKITDRLYSKCIVLDDGKERVAIVVVDSCMMPRDLLDRAKELAHQQTGIPTDRMLISATHTHSAPAAMGGLGTPADEEYVKFLPGRIAEGIRQAVTNLAPARVGWAVIQDYDHTYCRRWIRRPDKLIKDPFGELSVRAHMHPGFQSPDAIGPSGPVDPDLSVLSIQSSDGKPLAVLANYSMHYYDSQPISADYFGRFAVKIAKLIGVEGSQTPFVGIMSQGTSGDQMWMDYGAPRNAPGLDKYSEEVAQVAFKAYQTTKYHDWVPLKMAEAKLKLDFRLCDETRLAWAKNLVAEMNGRLPRNLPEVYAYEQVYLRQRPTAELKLQAIRIGDLGITAMPNEVYAITGLKIKTQSPLQPTFNIELANGAEGYIPPPEQHRLGGYTTWAARTAGLEVNAEPRITDTVLRLLEEVAGKPRRKLVETHGEYAQAVLAAKPYAYWRLGEFGAPVAMDATGHKRHAMYDGGIAFYLDGPSSPVFSGEKALNRCVHLAGGRLKSPALNLGNRYSVELWFWNGLPDNLRGMTGWLLSHGDSNTGLRLGIGGTNGTPGRLTLNAGGELNLTVSGSSEIKLKTWNHLALVRDGTRFTVYLNGNPQPELSAQVTPAKASRGTQLYIGSSGSGDEATFEGKIDEVAVYRRALSAKEIAAHHTETKP